MFKKQILYKKFACNATYRANLFIEIWNGSKDQAFTWTSKITIPTNILLVEKKLFRLGVYFRAIIIYGA